ncbi:MAG: hypothetical protein LLG01_18415 [Planctomycetaceae bacterium]|nr:hypothetical protein [Planctomycetaceae bacterium]
MSSLKPLRSQLAALMRRRSGARAFMGWSALVLAGLWLLYAMFLVDILFVMTRVQRFIALAAIAGALAWVMARMVRPWLARKEDAIDVALKVERQRSIDSDLVAAMQFETPAAASWGSKHLEQAVIDRVAEQTQRWSLASDLPEGGLRRRLLAGLGTGVLLIATLAIFPQYSGIFLMRLMFSSAFYPTDTEIRDVRINNQSLGVIKEPGFTAHCPVGRAVNFRVNCAGVLPREGHIDIKPVGEGAAVTLGLTALDGDSGAYVAQLEQMTGEFDFKIYIGDARTQWARLIPVPPPVVQPIFKPTVPDYAKAAGVAEVTEGFSKRLIAVYDGASVDLQVRCLNKPLKSVELVVGDKRYALKESGQDGRLWRLPATGTPLSEVTGPIDYEIAALDSDDLPPVEGIKGQIRLEDDRAPTLEASVARLKEVVVLPNARPTVRYKLGDDYGISALTMKLTVRPAAGGEARVKDYSLLAEGKVVSLPQLPLDEAFSFDLAPLALVKGDAVEVVLEGRDYRGKRPGHTTAASPIMLKVTDQAGALQALTKDPDAQSEQKIRQIINRSTTIEERAKP